MIYFIYGDDHFRVREHVEAVKEAAQQAGVSIITLEGEGLSIEAWHDHLGTGSMFAAKQVIFLKNLLSTGRSDLIDEIIRSLETLPEGVTVVLWEEGVPDRRSRHFATLSKKAKTIEKSPLSRGALARWILERAEKKGLQLSGDIAQSLALTVGNDLAQMENEIEKLALFGRGRAVTPEDVDRLTVSSVPPSVFALLDALGNRADHAPLLVEQLLEGGEEPLHLLSMLAYQLRNLLLVQDLLSTRPDISPAEVARQLGLHPFVAQKTLAQGQLFNQEELIALHHKMTELDHSIKTGGIEAPDAIVLLASVAPRG